jgi:hypothetical protein
MTQVFWFHGSKCTTEATPRQLNVGWLQAGQSGGYRQMAKFAIWLRSWNGDVCVEKRLKHFAL